MTNKNNMYNLKNCTFIIPIRIDSDDRVNNFNIVMNHLCSNLQTNIIIMESDSKRRVPSLLTGIGKGYCNIIYMFDYCSDTAFHRTRLLNEMLYTVKTDVVVNYDIDILLKPMDYLLAYNYVVYERCDLIYPYRKDNGAMLVNMNTGIKKLEDIKESDGTVVNADSGHCQFFNTKSYRNGGMENEYFVSWSPEDQERKYRFLTLGYKVNWLQNQIYHLEHYRGVNSSPENPHIFKAAELFKEIMKMSKNQLREYYNNVEYLKKYR
jgi:hypothetical protein